MGGWADGLLGLPSPRFPDDPLLERLLLGGKDLGRPQGVVRVPTPPHPPVLRILLEGSCGVSLHLFQPLPLKHLQEAPGFSFYPLWASPYPASKEGILKHKSVSLSNCSEASQGNVSVYIRVTRPWATRPSPVFSSCHHSADTWAFSSSF